MDRRRTDDGDDPVHRFDRVADFLQERPAPARHLVAVPPDVDAGGLQVAMQPFDERLVVGAGVGDENARLGELGALVAAACAASVFDHRRDQAHTLRHPDKPPLYFLYYAS